MTCHWFRHHAGVNCIPLLTCQMHEGLISNGEHLIRRCQGWTPCAPQWEPPRLLQP